MAVQAPLLLDNLGFPVIGSSREWMGIAANSEAGLPDPFANLGQPVQDNGLLNIGLFDRDGGIVASSVASSSCPSSALSPQSLPFSDPLADEFERQRHETELFIQLQNESLRYKIEQQKMEQITALLNFIESKTLAMVTKTEQDLAQVTRRTRELEDSLKMAEMETQAWQRIARENEAMVVGLNNMMGQAQERLCWAASAGGPAQDAESICECGGGAGEDDKTGLQDDQIVDEVGMRKMGCKWCKSHRSCVVFLPCKHLCACRQCGSLLGLCPVCKSVKEGSIEVFLN